MTSWDRVHPMQYTEYTAKCIETLLTRSQLVTDHSLAWKVRVQRLIEETHELRKLQKGHAQSVYQIELILKGIESQLTEWEAIMPPDVANLRRLLPTYLTPTSSLSPSGCIPVANTLGIVS